MFGNIKNISGLCFYILKFVRTSFIYLFEIIVETYFIHLHVFFFIGVFCYVNFKEGAGFPFRHLTSRFNLLFLYSVTIIKVGN